jgi:hypothetical protein
LKFLKKSLNSIQKQSELKIIHSNLFDVFVCFHLFCSFKLSKVKKEVAGDFLNKMTKVALLDLKFTLLNLVLWTKISKNKLSRGILSLDLNFLS